ncbi:MAG TPA: 6-hydroxymethylpterin diphosphokinase MptE-like protein [Candidatus Nitrosocosmicus sp.]|nr:6-hydroxymethylpterin diphosphokinase MptE-like protein [Candidatus Nitrosocosmicus sp.]
MDKDFFSSVCLSQNLSDNRQDFKYFDKINQSKVIIVGAGPSIEEKQIQDYILSTYQKLRSNNVSKSKKPKLVLMVADGASELILDLQIVPDFVVTDLDGPFESLLKAGEKGSVMVVHAHGDNIEKISNSSVSNFKKIVGTTQSFPLTNIFNYGGFTDGDRCVFIADHFLAKEIVLIGMDFDSRIGYFSKREVMNYEFKRRKLFVAKSLIEMLLKRTNSEIVQISSSNYTSPIYGVNKNIIL